MADPTSDEEVWAYVDGIDAANRPLFDRVDRLIREVCPDVELGFAYRMPTYVHGEAGLHVASWKHGLSFYGWRADRSGGFADRHPELAGEKGTLRLPPAVADGIDDDELRDFFRAVFLG
jgi:hypothetical protein